MYQDEILSKWCSGPRGMVHIAPRGFGELEFCDEEPSWRNEHWVIIYGGGTSSHSEWWSSTMRQTAFEFMEQRITKTFQEFREELGELMELKRMIKKGDVLLLRSELSSGKQYSHEEIESCKALIIDEFRNTDKMYPSDITEKYGIDIELAMMCFDMLAKEGRIDEL